MFLQERDQLTLVLEEKKSVEAELTVAQTKLLSANEEVIVMTMTIMMAMMTMTIMMTMSSPPIKRRLSRI